MTAPARAEDVIIRTAQFIHLAIVDVAIENARVVVIPVGISRYRKPPRAQINRGRSRFEDLPAVETDLAQLSHLFGSKVYKENGFVVLPAISGTAGKITDRLNEVAQKLALTPGRTVLLFWTGHGDTPDGGDLRLATVESYHPMAAGEGLPPAELVNKLAGSGAKAFCLVLDVCQAGAAGSVVAATAAQRFREIPDSKFHGMAALFSAHPYEEAEEGLFVEVLERVLRTGPSPQARSRIAERGWGGFTYNRLLTMREVEDVVQVEFELLQQTKPIVQTPAGQSIGRAFGVFPNPLFKSDAPPVGVEVARRRWLRQQDFDAHFLPKARGLEPGEDGWFFSGRTAVSREIVDWLSARGEASADNLYVLTGDGGTGKSAIIGRVVALSDPDFRSAAKSEGALMAVAGAEGTAPPVGCIDAALHLRNLDLLATAVALSELLEIDAPDPGRIDDWVMALAPVRLPGAHRPVTVALDALDESVEPARIAEQLIQPLAARGWRIIVGTRPSAEIRGATQLLIRLGPAHRRDLDTEKTTEADIAEYVKRRLVDSPGSPYTDVPADAARIAGRIAAKAKERFLFARIAASGLLRRPRIELENLEEAVGENVGDALARDLAIIDDAFRAAFGRQDRGGTALLAALAWAEGAGLPSRDGLWATVASALQPEAPPYTDEHVQWVLREAGRYILEGGDGEQAVYRLFHQSLDDHFRAQHDPETTGTWIATALLYDVNHGGGWDYANPYVVRSLPAYFRERDAAHERLCTDPWYLRRALDLIGVDGLADMLNRAFRTNRSGAIEAVAKSIQRARVALNRDPAQLATQLHARLAQEELGSIKLLVWYLPRIAPAIWLRSRGASLGWRAALQTMQTFGAKVRALAFGFIDGNSVIAVGAGTDVVVWNPRMGALPTRVIANDGLRVTGLAIGILADRDVVAVAASYDGRLVIRDARTGAAVGEPMGCGYGPLAMGRIESRNAIAIPDGGGFIVRAMGVPEQTIERRFQAAAVGQYGGALVAVERTGDRYRARNLDTGEEIGKEVDLPADTKLVTVGELRGAAVLCHASAAGDIGVRDLSSGEQLGAGMSSGFRVRTLVAGEVEGEFFIAAGNDTDNEGGYVALRQPLTGEASSRPLDAALRDKRIVGVGLAATEPGRSPPRKLTGADPRDLVLLFEDVGAVDPLTWELLSREPGGGRAIEVVNGAWAVPRAVAQTVPHELPRGELRLRTDRALEWPATCHAWGTVDGRLVEARGTWAGTIWIIDVERNEVVRGPFRSIGEELVVHTGVKSARTARPTTAIALSTWHGRGVVATAYLGRATAYDIETEGARGSPETGNSDIVAVALGEAAGRTLLATASSGGAVTIWEAPSMKRLASVTLDFGVAGVWLAGSVLAARTTDNRFHVFDIVTRT